MSLRTFTLSLLLTVLAFGPLTAAIVVPVTPATAPAEVVATTPGEAAALEAVREYRESLKNMSAKERRELKREQRRAIKDVLDNRQDSSTNTILLVIVTILLPPVGVLLYEGELNNKFWIALLLTLLFYLPGLIYALLVIFGNM